MSRKRVTLEQIVAMLREAEVLLSQGVQVTEVWRKLGVSEQTYCRCRKEFGGMRVDQAKRLKELEQENARLKELVADLSLDKAICVLGQSVWTLWLSSDYSVTEKRGLVYELFLTRGTPDYIRSDKGPEFVAHAVRSWLTAIGVTTLYIEPGGPWENGYVESYIGKLRDEFLNGEILDTLMEAKVLIEGWRREYNRFRPQSSLGYRPPAPEAPWLEKLNQGVVY